MMNGEQFRRLKDLFERLAELPPDERLTALEQSDGIGAHTRRQLHDLLSADDALALTTARSAIAAGVSSGAVGQRVGAFVLERELGHGGMGSVFLARRAVPGGTQQVALKCLYPIGAAGEFERRFHSEISVLEQLSHPHIARLIDAGQESDGRCWIAMEFIEGLPLLQYCEQHKLGIAARLALFQTLCEAVSAAHRNLIVHRDIKSSNVLVREDGELFLIDFGIARTLSAAAEVTQLEERFLSPLNAAPEQVLGEATTTSSDVYGLGVLLYELLCGLVPIDPASTSGEAMRQAVLHQVPSLAAVRLRHLARTAPERAHAIAARRGLADAAHLARSLSGDLEQICALALRKRPHERYASVDRLREDLDRAMSGLPISARGNERLYRIGRWLRRHVVAVALTTAATITLLGGVIALWLQARTLEQERDHAQAQTQLAQQQSQRAEFLSNFLLDAFEQADPSHTMGKTLTAKQILDAGARQLRSAEDVDLQSRARIAITLADVHYRLGLNADGDELVKLGTELLSRLSNAPPRLLAHQHYVEGIRASHEARWVDEHQHAEAGLSLLGSVDDASGAQLWYLLKGELAQAAIGAGDRPTGIALMREQLQAMQAMPAMRRENSWDLRTRLAKTLDMATDTRPEARTLLDSVLSEELAAHVDGSPSYALALRFRSSVAQRSGNPFEARDYAEKSLAIYQRLYGDDNLFVAGALNSLANAESWDGHPQQALVHYLRAHSIYKSVGDRSVAAGVLYNIGNLYNEQLPDLEKAEQYYRAAEAGYAELLGKDSYNAVAAEEGVIDVLMRRKRYTEAAPLIEHSTSVMQKLDPTLENMAQLWSDTAIVRHAQGRDDEARKLLRQALPALIKYADPESHFLLRAKELDARLHVS